MEHDFLVFVDGILILKSEAEVLGIQFSKNDIINL